MKLFSDAPISKEQSNVKGGQSKFEQSMPFTYDVIAL